jgi:hypothetical protein
MRGKGGRADVVGGTTIWGRPVEQQAKDEKATVGGWVETGMVAEGKGEEMGDLSGKMGGLLSDPFMGWAPGMEENAGDMEDREEEASQGIYERNLGTPSYSGVDDYPNDEGWWGEDVY